MPRSIPVASGTAGVQAAAGSSTLMGCSARENAATAAAATVVLRNGTSSSDPIVAVVELAAGTSQTVTVPAIDCPNGIFVDRQAGETELAIYIL